MKSIKYILLLALSLAAMAPRARAAEGVSLDDTDKGYLIEGNFEVQVPAAEVWAVLTDYAGLKGVVSTITESAVLSHEGCTALVSQKATGHFLFFSRDVDLLLKIEEFPTQRIVFKDISAKSFAFYQGSWDLHETSDGSTVQVRYRLEVNRAALAPVFLEKSLFKDNAFDLLCELKAEIIRRASSDRLVASSAR